MVGLAGTALGIGGTLVAQWLAGHRENEREQRRWQREEQRQWLVDRREAYAALHAAVESWDDLLESAWDEFADNGRRVLEDFDAREHVCQRRFDEARGLVDLLAPEAVRRVVGITNDHLVGFGWFLRGHEMLLRDAVSPVAKIGELRDVASKSERDLLDRLREDLGVEGSNPET